MYEIVTPTAEDLPERSLPFLKGNVKGYDVDIRTPLFEGKERKEVAAMWGAILYKDLSILSVELVQMEEKQEAKIGPYSRRKPFADRFDDVASYYEEYPPPLYSLSDLRRMELDQSGHDYEYVFSLPHRRLRPIGFEEAAYQLPQNTNSGEPLFMKRGEVVHESIAQAKSGVVSPAMMGWRGSSGQTGDYYGKQRVVWMVAYSFNIVEARFQTVLQPFYRSRPEYFAAVISMEVVDEHVTRMMDSKPEDALLIGTDYANYDQHNQEQQSWFWDEASDAFQAQHEETFQVFQYYGRNMELVCTPEVKFTGTHGWASGWNFTLTTNSHINQVVQCSSPVVLPLGFQVQGDDGCGVIKPDGLDVHLTHLNACGFSINEEKVYQAKNSVIYLQRLHHVAHRHEDGICHGIYPTMRALNSLLGQERFHRQWDKDMESLRTISILENCKWHPLFVDFCKFTAKFGDLYLLEFIRKLEDPHFRRGRIHKANAMPGFLPSYNTDVRLDGILTFESVRVIKEM